MSSKSCFKFQCRSVSRARFEVLKKMGTFQSVLRVAATALALLLSLPMSVIQAQTRSSDIFEQTDPRASADLTICTQNLDNFGRFSDMVKRKPGFDQEDFRLKLRDLIERMVKAECDVIAVQEVLGSKKEYAEEGLKHFVKALKDITGRLFDIELGETNDRQARVGFLVARDRATVLNRVSYFRVELPKISADQKPREFSRGPFEIQLSVKSKGEGIEPKLVTVVTFHFKSKRGGREDPARLEWETHRMEMAEALRRVVVSRHKDKLLRGQSALVVLGDRNSNFDSASARILEGVTPLRVFQGSAPCRLSERGIPLCSSGSAEPQVLFSVLTEDPETKFERGTYIYKTTYSWIDDILLPAESLPLAREFFDKEGNYASGIVRGSEEGSDHALAYVRLNW